MLMTSSMLVHETVATNVANRYTSAAPNTLVTPYFLRLFSGSTNGLVPAQSGTTTHESDEWYNFVGDGLYVYRCRNSGAANNFVYTAADCFFDAPLAAAQTGLVPARFQFAEDILHELSPFGLCASYRLGGHAGSGKANICKICNWIALQIAKW